MLTSAEHRGVPASHMRFVRVLLGPAWSCWVLPGPLIIRVLS
jgi:hypothetical protein